MSHAAHWRLRRFNAPASLIEGPPIDGIYFAKRYFGARFFGPRYFG